ncbi:MAG TPA: hypothetical protein VFU02_12735, partial [Polyangiaceae bacterium]|nr:hypothetical protein [Polyangiaceae bacterium]
ALPAWMNAFAKWVGLCALMSLGACGRSSDADQKQHEAYEAARQQRQKLLTELRGTTPEQANRCEVSDGDCLILVGERREALFAPNPACDGREDPYDREECQGNQLVKDGKLAEVTDYYKYENWCLAKVVECADNGLQAANEQAHTARLEQRRQQLLTSTDVNELSLEIGFARERVGYLRATLPHDKESLCADLAEVKTCRQRALRVTEDLEAELAKDDGAYDEKRAAELFHGELTTQASCFEPEHQCLSQTLADAGENGESKQHLKRNLSLLKERETLRMNVPEGVASECADAANADFGKKVESSYARYAKKPNTLFRVFLHQAYAKLHSAQVKCMRQHQN